MKKPEPYSLIMSMAYVLREADDTIKRLRAQNDLLFEICRQLCDYYPEKGVIHNPEDTSCK